MQLSDGKFYGNTVRQTTLTHFCLTQTVYSADVALPRHHHENPYFSLLLEGNYLEKTHQGETIIAGGHSIFRPFDHEHANVFDGTTGRCFNLELKNDISSQFSREMKEQRPIILKQSSLDLFLLYYRFVKGHPADTLDMLSFEIITALFEKEQLSRFGQTPWINTITARINDMPAEQHSVDSLASTVNIHPVYMLRKFKEKTGLRLSEYITRVRLEKAANSIVAGKGNLTDITYDSGFYDQPHFTRQFKHYFGASPRDFGKTLKG